jgi:hypothetical protein
MAVFPGEGTFQGAGEIENAHLGREQKKSAGHPPIEIKVEMTRERRGGISGLTSTPDTGKGMPHLLLYFSQC